MRAIVRGILRKLGYRLTRDRPANRFQAMDEAFHHLRARGYRPGMVIDGGANRGQFFRLAHPIFPEAEFHLIEPQPACHRDLRGICSSYDSVHLHPTVITEPGQSQVRMRGGGPDGSTGAWVSSEPESSQAEAMGDEILVPATTLDELFAAQTEPEDRTLLKLDLESHEIAALKGGSRLLRVVEVVVTEVNFYNVSQLGAPVFADMLLFLLEREFELYDVANLSPRPRDSRLRMGDVIFLRKGTPLLQDDAWG